jgi:hypothetical protein
MISGFKYQDKYLPAPTSGPYDLASARVTASQSISVMQDSPDFSGAYAT